MEEKPEYGMTGRSRKQRKSRKKKSTGRILIGLVLLLVLGAAAGVWAGLIPPDSWGIRETAASFFDEEDPPDPMSKGHDGDPSSGTADSDDFREGMGQDDPEATDPEKTDAGETGGNPESPDADDHENAEDISGPDAGTREPRYTADAPDTLPLTQAAADEVVIRFAGDILFDENYAIMASMLQRSGGTPRIETAFDAPMLELMRGADLFMVNNEFPYSKRGEPLKDKQFTFRARPEYASLLLDMGADIVGLANNHVNDHGRTAMLDTFDTLDGLSIPYIGAGRNLGEASRIQYYTNGEMKLGIVAATQIERFANPDTVGAGEESPGVFRCMNIEALLNRVREAKEQADCCIVFIHWGTEGTENIDDWQKKQARQIAEAGADLIIGGHPHVLQPFAIVEGVPVIYSLGNYLFNSRTLDTGLMEARFDAHTGRLSGLRFYPALQSGCRTTLLTGTEQARVLEKMRQLSQGVTIDDAGNLQLP